MPRTAVVVADAARARLFTYEPPNGRPGMLVERVDLVDPERRLRSSLIHSDSRPGTAVAAGHLSFGLDDHRDQHRHEIDRRFASEIYLQLDELLGNYPARRVVIVASPHILGLLRLWTGGLAKRKIELHERALDLTLETTPKLHDHLAKLQLIPARTRAGV